MNAMRERVDADEATGKAVHRHLLRQWMEVYLRRDDVAGMHRLLFPDMPGPERPKLKDEFIEQLVEAFFEGTRLRAFFDTMPPDVRKAAEDIVWLGPRTVSRIEHDYGFSPLTPLPPSRTVMVQPEVRSHFGLFSVHNPRYRRALSPLSWFSMAEELAPCVKEALGLPDRFLLMQGDPPDSFMVMANEPRALEDAGRYQLFAAGDHLEMLKNGRVSKSTVRKLAEFVSLPEFFPNEEGTRERVEARLMADLLADQRPRLQAADPKATLGALASGVLTIGHGRFFDALMAHLRGRNHVPAIIATPDLTTLLAPLKPGVWTTVNSLHNYSVACGHLRNPYSEHTLQRIEVTVAEPYYQQHYRVDYTHARESLSVDFIDHAVTMPLLQGQLAVLSLLGVVDVAYERPWNLRVLEEQGVGYLTPFDGVAFVRLTGLGNHLLGFDPDYRIPEPAAPREAEVVLDDTYLVFTLSEPDRLKEATADALAERLGPLRYRVTYRSFLRGCRTRQDVDLQVDRFRRQIASDVPEVWQRFFREVRHKVAALEPVDDVLVFRLDGGPDLVRLMARDEILSRWILKAEGHHVIVEKKNLRHVRRRLEEFGYLVE
jgi:hypothetical protein